MKAAAAIVKQLCGLCCVLVLTVLAFAAIGALTIPLGDVAVRFTR